MAERFGAARRGVRRLGVHQAARPAAIATLDLRIDYLKPATRPRTSSAMHSASGDQDVAFVRALAFHDDENDPIAAAAGSFIIFEKGRASCGSADDRHRRMLEAARKTATCSLSRCHPVRELARVSADRSTGGARKDQLFGQLIGIPSCRRSTGEPCRAARVDRSPGDMEAETLSCEDHQLHRRLSALGEPVDTFAKASSPSTAAASSVLRAGLAGRPQPPLASAHVHLLVKPSED